jgi:hypothetical protein
MDRGGAIETVPLHLTGHNITISAYLLRWKSPVEALYTYLSALGLLSRGTMVFLQ